MTKARMVTATMAATGETKKVRLLPGYIVKNGKRHYLPVRVSAKMKALRQKQRAEQERNNDIFAVKFLPELLKTHRGQVAVMKKGGIIGFYSSYDEAIAAAERRYRSRVYSIHDIEEPVVIDLGIHSCVMD